MGTQPERRKVGRADHGILVAVVVRSHHQTDDEQPSPAVRIPGLEPWRGDHRLHRRRSRPHLPPRRAAAAPDAAPAEPSAAHQGNQREVQEQPSASWPGGHETVQRDGREPRGLSRPARHTDAHLHRALLGHQRRVALHPGEPRGPLQQALQLAALPGHRRPRQPGFPRHGPRARTHARGEHPRLYPRGALRVQHVRTTEDESGRLGRPDAAKHPTDDAVHVPRHVRDVQPLLPPRTCRLLGGFYIDRYRDAIFRHRLGRTLPASPIGPERRHSETRAYIERGPAG